MQFESKKLKENGENRFCYVSLSVCVVPPISASVQSHMKTEHYEAGNHLPHLNTMQRTTVIIHNNQVFTK